jgi:hypothetical protein
MLGQSDWPSQIVGLFDLIIFEYCPKEILTFNNYNFILSKLKKEGLILFFGVMNNLFTKKEFKIYIQSLKT